MSIPQLNSFTPLGTVNPPSPCLLLPGSCNPVMDLLVVFTSTHHLPPSTKGKERADEAQKVSLYRVGGSLVWSTPYDNILAGMAWSTDGLYLSILTVDLASILSNGQMGRVTLSHLSVHDGSVVLSTQLQHIDRAASKESWECLKQKNGFWTLGWTEGDCTWPDVPSGSNRMVIDQLPRPSPVEPPKPSNPLLFNLMQQQNKNKPKTTSLHSSLSSFPRLLPTHAQSRPQYLKIIPSSPLQAVKHLSGTYAGGSGAMEQTLVLAGIAHRMSDYFDIVLRGLENAETAHKEGAKQTMIWREELETCAEQQGMTSKEVMDDLFRFLMTGRSCAAIIEWLGNRLTGRVLSKWESTVAQSLKDVQKVLVESVQPALERIILLLEEVVGLAKIPGWMILEKSYTDGLRKARRLHLLLERVRRLSRLQSQGAEEWFRWLQYEITRQSATDPSTDQLPAAMHDIKLVWSYLRSGFVDPPLAHHFPGPVDAADLPVESYAAVPDRSYSLNDTLRETLSRLSNGADLQPETPGLHPFNTPTIGDDSVDSSAVDITIEMDEDEAAEATISRASSFSSSGTVERKKPEEVTIRKIELEPMIWAKSLVESCKAIFDSTTATQVSPDMEIARIRQGRLITSSRRVGGDTWIAASDPGSVYDPVVGDYHTVWLVNHPEGDVRLAYYSRYALEGETKCLAIEFFDDEEVVLLLEKNGEGWMVTVNFADLADDLTKAPEESRDDWTLFDWLKFIETTMTSAPQLLPIARARRLDRFQSSDRRPSLAMNGRDGRRIGCVMTRAEEIVVFDMEQDEDEAGDEEQEGDETMEQ